jgi:hypothetical protein
MPVRVFALMLLERIPARRQSHPKQYAPELLLDLFKRSPLRATVSLKRHKRHPLKLGVGQFARLAQRHRHACSPGLNMAIDGISSKKPTTSGDYATGVILGV